jgi:hypothetical protein
MLMRISTTALSLLLLSCNAFGNVIKPDPDALAKAVTPFPWQAWTALLQKHVDDKGRVDYAAIDRAAFEPLFAAVAASSPKRNPGEYPSRDAQKAFYIDAYNVLVWKDVLTRLPKLKNVDSEKTSFFYFTKFIVGGDELNLYDLENKIVRPQFKDARMHMALNCASGGCPMLPREAFTPANVDALLSREARRFCNEKRNVDFDAATRKLKLSHIFDWYKDDFGKTPDKVIAWINNWRSDGEKLPADAKIEYVDYDWTLNDQHLLKR